MEGSEVRYLSLQFPLCGVSPSLAASLGQRVPVRHLPQGSFSVYHIVQHMAGPRNAYYLIT